MMLGLAGVISSGITGYGWKQKAMKAIEGLQTNDETFLSLKINSML
jgi:hypothetical protein